MRINSQSTFIEAKAGIIGGMFLSVTQNIYVSDLLRTAILAIVGTLVSFTLSLILQWLIRKRRKGR